uniref:SfiI-subtelomeric related protein family member n=1 Tax=Theileria annulata TaxID=5874 RepID=A0A3B0MK00_THEAN
MKLKLIFLILIDLVICLNNGFPNFDIMNKITNLNPLILDIGLETSNDNYKYLETIYGSIYIPNDGFGFYKIFYLNNDKKIIIYESNIFNEFIKKISCKRFFNNIISILLFLFNGNILQFTNHKHFWILNNQLLFNITKYIYNSDTVLGHTDSTSPTMSTTNSTLGTIGPSTVTQGKRANFTATECTMGKGANFTATECTTNTTTNTSSGINTVEDPFGVNGIIGHVPDTVMEKSNEIITYKLENGKLQTIKTEINEFKPIENNFINKIIFTNKFTGIDFTIWESNIWYTSAKQITLISLKTYNHVTVLGPTGTGPTGTGATATDTTTDYGPNTTTNINNTIADITTGYGGYGTGIEGTPLGSGTGAVGPSTSTNSYNTGYNTGYGGGYGSSTVTGGEETGAGTGAVGAAGATGTGSTGGVGASTVMEEIKLDKLLIILQVDNNYRIFRWDNILNLWIDLSLLSPKLTEMKFYPNDINTNNLFKNYSVYLKGLNYCVEFHYSIDFLRLFTPKLIHTFEYNFINNTVNINNKIFNSINKINGIPLRCLVTQPVLPLVIYSSYLSYIPSIYIPLTGYCLTKLRNGAPLLSLPHYLLLLQPFSTFIYFL